MHRIGYMGMHLGVAAGAGHLGVGGGAHTPAAAACTASAAAAGVKRDSTPKSRDPATKVNLTPEELQFLQEHGFLQ